MLTNIFYDAVDNMLGVGQQTQNNSLKRKREEDNEGPIAKRSSIIDAIPEEDEDSEEISLADLGLSQEDFAEGMRAVDEGDVDAFDIDDFDVDAFDADAIDAVDFPEYVVDTPAETTTAAHKEPVYNDYSEYVQEQSTYQDMQSVQHTQNSSKAFEQLQQFAHRRFTQPMSPFYQPQQLVQHRQPLHQSMQHNQHPTETYYEEYQPQCTQQPSAVKVQRQRRPRKASLHQLPISAFFAPAAPIAVEAPPTFESTSRQASLPQRPVSSFFAPDVVETQPIASSSVSHPMRPVKKIQEKKIPAFQAPAVACNDSATMFNINSRLVLSGGRKVTVSVGEIRRRMGAPECQDWRMIAELTRTPTTSQAKFQKEMADHGFTDFDKIPHRGLSTISSLLEADALTLAQDFNKIISSELSREILCSIAAGAAGEDIQNHIDEIIKHLTCARAYLLCTGRVPDAAGLDMNCPDVRAVRSFSLLTHGFGTLAAVSVIDSLTIVIKQLQKSYPTASTLKRDLSPLTSLPQSDVIIPILEDDLVAFENDVLPRIGYAGTMVTVTRGEMRRRAQGPEKLQSSLLNAFIRKAKVKNTMPILREKLTKIGVTLASDNRKKAVSVTSWTALTEGEAMIMARETGEFLSQLPPSEKMRMGVRANPQSAEYLRLVANAICHAMFQIGETPAERKVERAADLQLLRFAMVSHHFGHNFYRSVMQWLHDSL